MGKTRRLHSPDSHTTYTTPLELLFSDLWGPSLYASTSRFKYYMSFVDSYSKFTWIYFLKTKAEALSTFQQFKSLVELQPGCPIKAIQSDWGLPSSPIQSQIPYDILFHTQPDYNFLGVFGCAFFPLLGHYKSHKLDFRSQECVFLCYFTSHKGYRCLASNGRLYISKDVLFNELRFPYPELFLKYSSFVPPSTSVSLPTLSMVPTYFSSLLSNPTSHQSYSGSSTSIVPKPCSPMSSNSSLQSQDQYAQRSSSSSSSSSLISHFIGSSHSLTDSDIVQSAHASTSQS
ncbi:hypothetical protein KIW84_041438 [Lathyrus oleraceus]|uniref:Retroviral polymerase SH3-like domain-containing protein n=1 Tax=Pisum sativum TaxID=3888 RepID=A0A9D4X866_PEA|nr:hypothetical protein KIW84_041438 [Pisum sativum]